MDKCLNLSMPHRARPPDWPTISERLVATRKAIGLRQSEFADRAGIGRNTYNQWEKGKRPQLDYALILCDVYGLTLDWIYRGDPQGLPHGLAQRLFNGDGDGDGVAPQIATPNYDGPDRRAGNGPFVDPSRTKGIKGPAA